MRALLNLNCPQCGSAQQQRDPEGVCVYFHGCRTCGVRLRPIDHDRCIFESYGDKPEPLLIAAE